VWHSLAGLSLGMLQLVSELHFSTLILDGLRMMKLNQIFTEFWSYSTPLWVPGEAKRTLGLCSKSQEV
jgi:hypothetical protein